VKEKLRNIVDEILGRLIVVFDYVYERWYLVAAFYGTLSALSLITISNVVDWAVTILIFVAGAATTFVSWIDRNGDEPYDPIDDEDPELPEHLAKLLERAPEDYIRPGDPNYPKRPLR
jgi:hypothetical protein